MREFSSSGALVRACRSETVKSPTTANILGSLPWLSRSKLSEFAASNTLSNERGVIGHSSLSKTITDFHRRADTLKAVGPWQPGAKRVARLAHQPNSLAYGRLLFQFVALDALAIAANSRALFVFIDYDTCSDVKFSRTAFPFLGSINGAAGIGLTRSCIPRRSDLTAIAPPPPPTWVDHIELVTKSSLSFCHPPFINRGLAEEIQDRMHVLLNDIRYACEASSSLAEACAIYLSRVVNLRLGLNVHFCPASILWDLIPETTICALLEEWPAIHSSVRRSAIGLAEVTENFVPSSVVTEEAAVLPLWWRCPCGTRAPLRSTDTHMTFSNRFGIGQCPRCERHIRMPLCEIPSNLRTAPRVVAHNALNRIGFGYESGANHIGSADHVLCHSLALSQLGWPVLQQAVWQAQGSFGTWIERLQIPNSPLQRVAWKNAIELISSGGASSLYYLSAVEGLSLAKAAKGELLSRRLDERWELYS